MRDYGKVSPQFWISKTGKALRRSGHEATIVALYLITCPHANMLGLYYLPTMFIAHETGLGVDGAAKGLQGAIEAGFCHYDEATEVVWVVEMARYQIADSLKKADLRVKGVQSAYEALPDNPYLARFYERYAESFHMTRCRESDAKEQAPCMALRSQEQEQEQKQDQEQIRVPATKPSPKRSTANKTPTLGVPDLVKLGVEKQHAIDWLKARKAKRLPLTQTALDGVAREAEKLGITLPKAIAIAAEKSWAGFNAKWPMDDVLDKPAAPAEFAGKDYGLGGRL